MTSIDRYSIIKKYKVNSLGAVYLAEDLHTCQQVVIQTINIENGELFDAMYADKTIICEQILSRLSILKQLAQHENIIDIQAIGNDDEGLPFVVMPHFTDSLKRSLSHTATPRTVPIPLINELDNAVTLSQVKQLLSAVSQLHSKGLIHGCLYPENIFLKVNNHIQLMPLSLMTLGLVNKNKGVDYSNEQIPFLSPEQSRGLLANQKSDIYSTATIICYLFTGKEPSSTNELLALCNSLPLTYNNWLLPALSSNFSERPENIEVFLSSIPDRKIDETDIENKDETKVISKITACFRNKGYIAKSDHLFLTTLAKSLAISTSQLNDYIEQIKKDIEQRDRQTKALMQWHHTLANIVREQNGNISDIEKTTLIDVGLLNTDKSKSQLLTLLLEYINDYQNNVATHKTIEKQRLKNNLIGKALMYVKPILLFMVGLVLVNSYLEYRSVQNIKSVAEQQAWYQVQVNHNIESYQEFLQKWPGSGYNEQALQALKALQRLAKEHKTIAEKNHLQVIEKAQHWLAKLGYDVIESGIIDTRTQFALAQFAKENHITTPLIIDNLLVESLQKRYHLNDQVLWQKTVDNGQLSAFQHYLAKFPQGRYQLVASSSINTIKQRNKKQRIEQQEQDYQQKKRLMQGMASDIIVNLVALSGGNFVLGCEVTPCNSKELPAQNVHVKAFSIMNSEVTFAMWDACVASEFCRYKPDDDNWGRKNRPVINVSYLDIKSQFIPWVNYITGRNFALPTEIQWEYAAKVNEKSLYSWGNEITCQQGQFSEFSGECGNTRKTQEVKSYPPNKFKLYDLHGNVWEWTSTCWQNNYQNFNLKSNKQNGKCQARALRGGSWLNPAKLVRSTVRRGDIESSRQNMLGFRLVLNE